MPLRTLIERWKDEPAAHQTLYAFCEEQAKADTRLWEHRQHINQLGLGFGATGLHWVWSCLLWDAVVRHMPRPVYALEIGVYRGQVLSLLALLGQKFGCSVRTVGVSPFDGRGLYGASGEWTPPDPECQDLAHLTALFERYSLPMPQLVCAASADPVAVHAARAMGPYDIVYIDGSHAYEDVRFDLLCYAPMVRPGGFLVGDDAACSFRMDGMYAGFPGCSKAFDEWLPPIGGGTLPHGSQWRHLFNVSHLRVWQREWLPGPLPREAERQQARLREAQCDDEA